MWLIQYHSPRLSMSRFFEFSLYKRTDELLRPAEKDLRNRFYSPVNTDLLCKKAVSGVDSGVSYVDVKTIMDVVFRTAINTDNLPEVSDMNNRVLGKIQTDAERLNTGRDRYAERAFVKSNLPTRLLPRPSYGTNGDDAVDLFRR
jgi:hypothetical protein